ncbi:MAG: 16S rRNA (adenine(1518)-N(6)/adenine(1519)-N(6))-dimethyltransferase, partial [Clostridia bacterium]|nr:16S rRNA (adenine(1518)-N(6)/adenine(1519)-N(6))-dimethyltransferase [Clostridia bacterium]
MSEYRDVSAGLAARMALTKYGFHFSHSLGQNFILDDKLVGSIVYASGVGPGDHVLEIGPGAGVMTRHLAEAGAKVTAIELDQSLEPVLSAVLEGVENAKVIFGDAMKLDMGEVMGDEPYKVVANLPYYITADVVQRMITQEK